MLELPHTAGCLVCGRDNPHGLHLHLRVDEQTGVVETDFSPTVHHIGFEGILHGGVLATVLDEAMVWAAIWSGKRACVAADLYVRFKHSAVPGQPLHVTAKVKESRARLITVTGEIRNAVGTLIATGEAKYVPLPPERHAAFATTFVNDPATARAAEMLGAG